MLTLYAGFVDKAFYIWDACCDIAAFGPHPQTIGYTVVCCYSRSRCHTTAQVHIPWPVPDQGRHEPIIVYTSLPKKVDNRCEL